MKGQSLKVAPDELKGEVGGSVKVTWTVSKGNDTYVIGNTRLYLGRNTIPTNLLYLGLSKLTEQNLAKEMFGERMKVNFAEPVYTMTLSNLNYTDMLTIFTLVVNIDTKNGFLVSQERKAVQITEVKGMYFLQNTLF